MHRTYETANPSTNMHSDADSLSLLKAIRNQSF